MTNKRQNEEEEQKFSEKWAADGNGIWCYGQISRVYVKKGRKAQEYMIRYDNGESMRGVLVEEHIELARHEDDSEDGSEEAKDNMDKEGDSGDESTDYDLDHYQQEELQENDKDVTDLDHYQQEERQENDKDVTDDEMGGLVDRARRR